MAKYTASDLTSLTSNEASAVSTINANFAGVEAAFENTLSRDGTTPNTMGADIDMNTNDLLNVGSIDADNILLNGSPVYNLSDGGAVWGEITGTLSSQTDLQAAIDGASSATLAPVSKTADFTFALADIGRTHNVSSASAVVATIPTNAAVAYPIGTKLRIYRAGTGTVKVVPAGGVTLRLPTGIAPKRPMGCRATHSVDRTVNWGSPTSVPWDSEAYDTDGFHDTVTNSERLTIPSGLGIKRVILTFYSNATSITSYLSQAITKNGTTTLVAICLNNVTFSNFSASDTTGVVSVVDGDYFIARTDAGTDTSISFRGSTEPGSFFQIQVTEIDAQGWIAYQYGTIEIQKVATDEWIVSDQSALG